MLEDIGFESLEDFGFNSGIDFKCEVLVDEMSL